MRMIDADAFVEKLFEYAITDADREFCEKVKFAIDKEPVYKEESGVSDASDGGYEVVIVDGVYEVVIAVSGRFRTHVKANSAEEAKTLGEYEFQEADFGELEDCDGVTVHVEDPDGQYHYM